MAELEPVAEEAVKVVAFHPIPELSVADEPTGSIIEDTEVKEAMAEEMLELIV